MRRRDTIPITPLLLQPILSLALALLVTSADASDRTPARRGDEADTSRRRGIEGDPLDRRPIEDDCPLTQEDIQRKQTTKVMNITSPPRCGAERAPRFKKLLLDLTNPDSTKFYLEMWGDRQIYFVYDPIYYYLRSNRTAYVTMFWIGPEGSVFIPFTNIRVEADRDHKLDPSNIIVEPVGLERWRAIATTEPHHLPCTASDEGFVSAIKGLQAKGPWAGARWDVMSKVHRRNRFR